MSADLFSYIYFVNIVQDIQKLLNKPFPQEEDWLASLRVFGLVSIFITFFLYVFTPFDMSVEENSLFMVCLGFGFMTFLGCIMFEIFARLTGFKKIGSEFTFGRWLLYMIGTMLCISLMNFLYIRLYFFGYIRWEFFIHQVRGTFLIGLFPVFGVGMWTLLRQERKYVQIAREMNTQNADQKKDLDAEGATLFGISISNVRYVEALQNYVKIGYVNADGLLQEQTERSTLKEILDSSQMTGLKQSHRSFLVNKNAIVDTSGNAQGLLLTLADTDRQIPVSRSKVALFRES